MRQIAAVGTLVLNILTLGCSGEVEKALPPTNPNVPLEAQVEPQREEAERAVRAYRPGVTGRIDDPAAPAAAILRQLPGVARVEVLVSPAKPARRIVHLADWHFVPRDLYALDLLTSSGKPLSEDEVNARYRDFLLQVELVQIEQEALLRCLARHQGLRRVRFEGLIAEEAPLYPAKAADVRAAGPALRDQLKDVRRLLRTMKGKEATPPYVQAQDIEKQAVVLLEEHRLDTLRLGALGRLPASAAVEVLPLDDAGLLDEAKPVRDGKVQESPKKIEARHDFRVRGALKSGPCSVLVLGGGHDLSAAVRRLGGEDTEYLRVVARRYEQFAGEGDRER